MRDDQFSVLIIVVMLGFGGYFAHPLFPNYGWLILGLIGALFVGACMIGAIKDEVAKTDRRSKGREQLRQYLTRSYPNVPSHIRERVLRGRYAMHLFEDELREQVAALVKSEDRAAVMSTPISRTNTRPGWVALPEIQ